MANTINTVLVGKYAGARVHASADSQKAYILTSDGRYIYFTKTNVQLVRDVSSIHTDPSILNTAVATKVIGVGAGMAMSQGKKSSIKEVIWSDGDTSLVEIDDTVAKAIIVSMYQNMTKEEELKAAESQKSLDQFSSNFAKVVGFGYVALYVLVWLMEQ